MKTFVAMYPRKLAFKSRKDHRRVVPLNASRYATTAPSSKSRRLMQADAHNSECERRAQASSSLMRTFKARDCPRPLWANNLPAKTVKVPCTHQAKGRMKDDKLSDGRLQGLQAFRYLLAGRWIRNELPLLHPTPGIIKCSMVW
ncbi:hypothetical protein NDU88_004626 [Pleurodeles waltl]|uniref:Uncharacterized protein n=1 Tax=Pleurodeles waltl TaxID=8319 RepID=A0AAV7TS19_PLEWA|nr:hypothetical protein NDU88_004626 [Pleurodeles waltl]